MLLVTAANGNQGKLLIPKLIAAKIPFRACVKSEASAARLSELGVMDVVVGDIADPKVWDKALSDVRTIYHIGPGLHPYEREMGLLAVDAAKRAGVEHFVFSSVLHSIASALVQHEIKRDIEEYLIESGIEFTILQPSNYMMPLKVMSAFRDSVFRLSWSLDRLQCLVDLDDVTDVAFKVLAEGEKHWGATYELVGEGRYSAYDLGGIISKVIGREVSVVEIDGDTYLKAFFGDVDPAQFPHQGRVLRAITDWYSKHDFVGNANILTWLLGREPTSFAQFVRHEYDSFNKSSFSKMSMV